MHLPNCCGSEDGELFIATDLVDKNTAVVAMWRCNTCGIITVVEDSTFKHP